MTMIQIALGSFLKEQELAINYLTYISNLPTQVNPKQRVTLFSRPVANLSYQQERFQLYDQYGQLFADDLLKQEFERLLPTLLANELVPMLFETPYLEGVFALIEGVRTKGYEVVVFRQQRLASWKVLDPSLLLKELATISERPQDLLHHLICQEEEEELILTTPSGETVMVETNDTRLSHEGEPTYYAVLDKSGEVVLGKIPQELLGILLFGILNDVSPVFLHDEFLGTADLTALEVADSQLLFESYRVSEPQRVTSVTDLKKNGEEICVSTDQKLVEEYYFWQPPSYSRLSRGILPKDLTVVLGQLSGTVVTPDYTEDRYYFTEKVLDLAASQDLTIFRVDRVLVSIGDTDDLEYTNGKISDFTIETRQTGSSNKIETLFEARCLHTDEVLFPDLTLPNLISKLVDYSVLA